MQSLSTYPLQNTWKTCWLARYGVQGRDGLPTYLNRKSRHEKNSYSLPAKINAFSINFFSFRFFTNWTFSACGLVFQPYLKIQVLGVIFVHTIFVPLLLVDNFCSGQIFKLLLIFELSRKKQQWMKMFDFRFFLRYLGSELSGVKKW